MKPKQKIPDSVLARWARAERVRSAIDAINRYFSYEYETGLAYLLTTEQRKKLVDFVAELTKLAYELEVGFPVGSEWEAK